MHTYLLKEPRQLQTWQVQVNNTNKVVTFTNCVPFTDCITEINYTQVDVTQKIDVVIPMYNLSEYSDAYSKTSGIYGNTIEMNQL